MRSLPSTATGRTWPGWGVREGPFGIRLFDVGVVALVILAIEVNVVNGGGPGAVALNAWAYLFGALLAVPILFRHRWPLRVLIASAVVMFFYYIFARRNISPAPVFFVPLYDAAVVGYLALAIAIPAVFMVIGLFVVEVSVRQGIAALTAEFLSQTVILALAVLLGEVVRSRRALTAETARRLRLAQEERTAEAGRAVAEERLRIARELHDTVAHGMATIAVQAGSALHVLGAADPAVKPFTRNDPASRSLAPTSRPRPDADILRAALTAIRDTSKGALVEMRSVLGQLRRTDHEDAGLERLNDLRDAVTAAGARVTVEVEGAPASLSAEADHSAYRILQESLTNVLRHAGPRAAARVCLRYQPDRLVITVTDDGGEGTAHADGSGEGTAHADGSGEGTAHADGSGEGTAHADGSGEGTAHADGSGEGTAHADGGGEGTAHADGGGSADGGDVAVGNGISGMRERAASAGGELTAGPLPGGGFRVRATLPTGARVGRAAPAYGGAGIPAARWGSW